MAKKHEFKPDRPYSSWISRLVPTKLQRKSILKWTFYGLVLLLLSVIQDVVCSRNRIMNATTDLVPCAIFLFCLLEGTENGSVFALTSSLLYVFSGSAPGTFSIIFITLIAVAITIFRQALLQTGLSTAIICTGLAMLLYELCVFIMGLIQKLTTFDRLGVFLLTAALSLIAAPILYPIGLAIGSIGGESWKE